MLEGGTGAATQADVFMHHYGVKEQGNVTPEQVRYRDSVNVIRLKRLNGEKKTHLNQKVTHNA